MASCLGSAALISVDWSCFQSLYILSLVGISGFSVFSGVFRGGGGGGGLRGLGHPPPSQE